jgi:hypothetical protein
MSDPLDFTSREEQAPVRRRRREGPSAVAWLLAVIALLLLVGVGLVSFFLIRPSIGRHAIATTSGADADYHSVLAVSFEEQAVDAYKLYWLRDAGKLPWFHDPKSIRNDTAGTQACLFAVELCGQTSADLASRKLELRKRFFDRHRIDYPDYKASFNERHPQTKLIFDEIVEETGKVARLRSSPLILKLGSEATRLFRLPPGGTTREEIEALDEQFWKFRTELLRSEVPSGIKAVRSRAMSLLSVKALAEEVK